MRRIRWYDVLLAIIWFFLTGLIVWYFHGWYTKPCEAIKTEKIYKYSYAPARCIKGVQP